MPFIASNDFSEIHEQPYKMWVWVQADKRILLYLTLNVEIGSLRSVSLILLFKKFNLFVRILLPTFLWFVFKIENVVCLDVSSWLNFNANHSVSVKFWLYSLCNWIACLYIIICSGRARLHSLWILKKTIAFCSLFSGSVLKFDIKQI